MRILLAAAAVYGQPPAARARFRHFSRNRAICGLRAPQKRNLGVVGGGSGGMAI